jgi:Domain of unknown function (DUF305)
MTDRTMTDRRIDDRTLEHDRSDSDSATTQSGTEYLRFGLMIVVSMVVMYGVMYLNTDHLSHVEWSETRFFMTLLMGASMAVVMMSFMWSMHRNRLVNIGVYVLAIVVFGGSLWLVRSQRTVDDRSYLRAMIPHHSIAVLTSSRAQIDDVRVRELADGIIASQCREIAEMQWLVNDIGEHGTVEDPDEVEGRDVPEFSEQC